ncbi:hypothetical protein D3C85_1060180 [compost metagenome]
MVEEFSFDIFLVESGNAIAKIHVTVHGVTGFAAPSSMAKRPHYDSVVSIRIFLLDGFVNV